MQFAIYSKNKLMGVIIRSYQIANKLAHTRIKKMNSASFREFLLQIRFFLF